MPASMVGRDVTSVSGKPKSAAKSVSQQQFPDSQLISIERQPELPFTVPVLPPSSAAIPSLSTSDSCARVCRKGKLSTRTSITPLFLQAAITLLLPFTALIHRWSSSWTKTMPKDFLSKGQQNVQQENADRDRARMKPVTNAIKE